MSAPGVARLVFGSQISLPDIMSKLNTVDISLVFLINFGQLISISQTVKNCEYKNWMFSMMFKLRAFYFAVTIATSVCNKEGTIKKFLNDDEDYSGRVHEIKICQSYNLGSTVAM